jgi:hypothetical protein
MWLLLLLLLLLRLSWAHPPQVGCDVAIRIISLPSDQRR